MLGVTAVLIVIVVLFITIISSLTLFSVQRLTLEVLLLSAVDLSQTLLEVVLTLLCITLQKC